MSIFLLENRAAHQPISSYSLSSKSCQMLLRSLRGVQEFADLSVVDKGASSHYVALCRADIIYDKSLLT